MALTSRKFFLRRTKMLEFLAELEKTDDPSAKTAYLPPGLSVLEIEKLLGIAPFRESLPEDLAQAVDRSKTGATLFWGDARKCLVLPPFPIKEKNTFDGYVASPLRLLLQSDFKIGLILVHLGAYAVGLCHGERLIASKVGTGLVHGRHRQGGSSQQRFQRRREKQVQEFLDRVCAHAREKLESEARLLDYIIYGGPRQTVLLLQKRCPFLSLFEERTLPPLDVPSPRQKLLETTVGRIWSSCVIEWQEASKVLLL